ncbi:hypothetical protein [Nocardioides donggukensis]|uniref:Uncharacterized protein n=1 Tax=Nocardioides donggukensis TaxID=2774019 RepID=A0A927K1Q4_9ACTN|nr:hypothetical protein [Nocardioides donggukensis]MBD8868752.1 hypothetical protein [Nocardioides donggukensis]
MEITLSRPSRLRRISGTPLGVAVTGLLMLLLLVLALVEDPAVKLLVTGVPALVVMLGSVVVLVRGARAPGRGAERAGTGAERCAAPGSAPRVESAPRPAPDPTRRSVEPPVEPPAAERVLVRPDGTPPQVPLPRVGVDDRI